MTQKQMNEALKQIPKEEAFDRAYIAFEGDLRIITKDAAGFEYRYTVKTVEGVTLLVPM